MSDQHNVQKVADLLWSAAETGKACGPVRDLLGGGGTDFAQG